MKPIKVSLLENLQDLRDVVNYLNASDEVVTLEAIHKRSDIVFALYVQVAVFKSILNGRVIISSFSMVHVELYKNNAENAGFEYTSAELREQIQKYD